MIVTLRALTCGWFTQPTSFFLKGADESPLRSPVPAYVIEHPRGICVFDTGFSSKTRLLYGSQPGLELTEEDDIGLRLRAIGIEPETVRWIVNSHFHLDHCGGNDQLPNATIIVQRRELEVAHDSHGSLLYDRDLFDTGQPVLAIDGEHDLFGDGSVTAFPTFGHTRGHQSLRIRLPAGDIVLAGDCCYLKRSLDELRISSGDEDEEVALSTLRRLSSMRSRGTRIFYGHDGAFWKTVPQGQALS